MRVIKFLRHWRLIIPVAALIGIFVYILIQYAEDVDTTSLIAIVFTAVILVYFIYITMKMKRQ